MNKEKKRIIRNLKTYFLIINLIIAVIAFGYLVSAQCSGGSCSVNPSSPSQTPNPSGSGGGSVSGGSNGEGSISGGSGGTYSGGLSEGSVSGGGSLGYDGSLGQVPGPNTQMGDVGRDIPFESQDYGAGISGGTGGVAGAGTVGSAGVAGAGGKPNLGQGVQGYTDNLLGNLLTASAIGGMGAFIGAKAGGEDGEIWGFVSGFAGATVYQIAKAAGMSPMASAALGFGVAALIFILTYKKVTKEKVEFNCLPWQAPIGGADCEKCNDFEECTEYTCKSLGQACELVDAGTESQKCIWSNPHDVTSPIIEMANVSEGHKSGPDKAIRPPATGVLITREKEKCIAAFTPLEFTFTTNEPAQCKIDIDLTKGFEEMSYYVGGINFHDYVHVETMALPSPNAINAVAPEIQNDGEYTFYIRCRDGNGNFNQNPFSVSFCVDPGPDTTAPRIEDVSIPSGNPIKFNQTKLNIEVYVNEPSECRWSRENLPYENMEEEMDCDLDLWEINNNNLYTCRTELNGIEDRKENIFYFRCKDQPWADEGDRNENKQSYMYKIIGTQLLNILDISPKDETIAGATDTIPVFLTIKTANGYRNGEAICYYSLTENEEDYIMFLDSNATNVHEQRQDLSSGEYTYYVKCVDLAGNAVYDSTSFKVETDRSPPVVIRAYKESGELKIITHEKAECSFSNIDCNFDIDDGVTMSSLDFKKHNSEWKINNNNYIRCKDKYNNQPDPGWCSIIVRPSDLSKKEKGLD